MITVELPDLDEMHDVIVRLPYQRAIYSKKRKEVINKSTNRPEDVPDAGGLYFMLRDGEVRYVGQTCCLKSRMSGHFFLKKYPDIDKVKFLQVEGGEQERLILEKLYQYYYFKGKDHPQENNEHYGFSI